MMIPTTGAAAAADMVAERVAKCAKSDVFWKIGKPESMEGVATPTAAFVAEKARLEREIQDSMDETMSSLKELSHNMDHIADMSQGVGSLVRPWSSLHDANSANTASAAGGADEEAKA